jgi:cation transport ATPase
MTDYSRWEALAREEELEEQREKERKRAANREKYYKEQEERKVKHQQEQEAKQKVTREHKLAWMSLSFHLLLTEISFVCSLMFFSLARLLVTHMTALAATVTPTAILRPTCSHC